MRQIKKIDLPHQQQRRKLVGVACPRRQGYPPTLIVHVARDVLGHVDTVLNLAIDQNVDAEDDDEPVLDVRRRLEEVNAVLRRRPAALDRLGRETNPRPLSRVGFRVREIAGGDEAFVHRVPVLECAERLDRGRTAVVVQRPVTDHQNANGYRSLGFGNLDVAAVALDHDLLDDQLGHVSAVLQHDHFPRLHVDPGVLSTHQGAAEAALEVESPHPTDLNGASGQVLAPDNPFPLQGSDVPGQLVDGLDPRVGVPFLDRLEVHVRSRARAVANATLRVEQTVSGRIGDQGLVDHIRQLFGTRQVLHERMTGTHN